MNKLPTISELIDPTLIVLSSNGPLSHRDIEVKIVELLGIPAHLRALIHSGKRTELNYRLSWARTKCKTLGLIVKKDGGMWCINN